jgi:hypothetical protein
LEGSQVGRRLEQDTFIRDGNMISKVGFMVALAYEPNDTGLCAQGIFQEFSGFANSLIGIRKLISPSTLKGDKII